MTKNESCPIKSPDQSQVEVVSFSSENGDGDFQLALARARAEAEKRFDDYMLVSWYDRDRDLESPPHASECSKGCDKDGYIHYGLSHNATLKVDFESGRFVFFFAPVEW